MPRPAKLLGSTTPRIWTPPLRPLNRKTSRGYACADFADLTGQPFLPWQRWLAVHALETLPGGDYRFRVILALVARQNGKSDAKRTITLWRMYTRPRSRIIGIAQDVALAREQWNLALETIHDTPELDQEFARVRNVNGDEMFWLANGSRYAIKAASRKAGRGYANDEVNVDELREQTDWRAWAAVSKTTMAKANSQIFCMSNAGDDSSVVLNQLRDAALSGRDDSVGLFEWSAPDGCELDDRRAWAQANPGLGHVISEAAIRTALHTDPPEIFRTEVLCQRVSAIDAAVDPGAWKDCADPAGTLGHLRDRVAACVDVAIDGEHVTLAVAARTDMGQVRIEVADAWKDTRQARAELPALLARIQPAAFAWYPAGPAGALGPVLAPAALEYNKHPGKRDPGAWLPDNGQLAGLKVTEACQGLADLVKGRQVLHAADPLLDAHILSASRLPSGDGWRFTRRGSTGHCDAAYAAAGAAYAALTMPEPRRARIRVLSA